MNDHDNTPLYPAFIKLTGRAVLVVGGGSVATRKVLSLLDCNAAVTVVSPDLTTELKQLHQAGKIRYLPRHYQPSDLKHADLVMIATSDNTANRQIAAEAEKRRLLCNVADVPELCSFYVPALVERGPLRIAISTQGLSPALAKYIRQQLESQFDAAYETFIDALADLRQHVKQKHPDDQARRARILEDFVHSDALNFIKNNQLDNLNSLIQQFKNK